MITLEKVTLGLVCVIIVVLGVEIIYKYIKQKRGK